MSQQHPDNGTKPRKPAADECCGGGSCCPCVWDEYREQVKQWQAQHNMNVALVKPN
ncbi:oxidoreductase-like domain-containing protein [Pseudoalteromonas mariniglutinosa]|uniref:oxidoreductase-like domain-containing protein n=1 Tax=Pseudoalteromonas mariniglutinosa TaxID=206042 RepID=UPI00384CE4A4